MHGTPATLAGRLRSDEKTGDSVGGFKGYTGEEQKVEKDEDKTYMTRKLVYAIRKMGETREPGAAAALKKR